MWYMYFIVKKKVFNICHKNARYYGHVNCTVYNSCDVLGKKRTFMVRARYKSSVKSMYDR